MTQSRRTKPVPEEKKSNRGRPSKYNSDTFPEQAYKLAKLGAMDKEIADFFDTHVDTIDLWKRTYPEFIRSIKAGKDHYDSRRVESSLLQRALGYEYTETKTEDIIITQGKGKDKISIPGTKVTTTNKIVPPSTTAQIFWLVNRQPQRWQHVNKTEVNHKGKVNSVVNHKGKVEIDDSPERAQAVFREMLRAGGADAFLLLGTDPGAEAKTH